MTLWTYTEPYEDDDASPEAAAAVTDRAITQFALRLKALLAMPVDSSLTANASLVHRRGPHDGIERGHGPSHATP